MFISPQRQTLQIISTFYMQQILKLAFLHLLNPMTCLKKTHLLGKPRMHLLMSRSPAQKQLPQQLQKLSQLLAAQEQPSLLLWLSRPTSGDIMLKNLCSVIGKLLIC